MDISHEFSFFGFLLNQLVAEIREIIINQALIDLLIL